MTEPITAHPQADLIREAAPSAYGYLNPRAWPVDHDELSVVRTDVLGDTIGTYSAMRNAVANLLDAGWTLNPPSP